MKIYSSGGEVILDVIVDDNSYRNRAIMGDHSVVLYFALPTFTEIPVGAYIDYQGERYTLERPEALKMKHSRNFEYTVTLEAYQTRAERWIFRNTVDARITFPLTAKPIEHLQMFVDNMNRRDTGWTVGECIDGVEKLISYDKLHCLEALQQMATTFDTEYEIVGKTVSLHKVEYNRSAPLALSYGRGNGFLPDIGRSNSGDSMPVEILFVAGGEDNIDPSTYGSAALLLPKGQTLRFDGTHFEDEEGFDSGSARGYITSADGLSLRRSDRELSSMAEDCLDCSDISPKRVGTVGQVIVVDADKNFYDFTDSDPASDPCPNFEDYLIEGETMTVIFQSGMLAGRELEVKYIHEAKTERGVAKLGRRFELVPQEIDGETMPNDTYKPAAGDTYAVFHCAMPQAYICDNTSKSGASWDMFRAGVKYMYENEDTKFTFSGTLDGIWAKKDWLNIGGKIILGGYVQFTDERFQKDPSLVRITGVKDYINKPHSPEITLSNETVFGGFSSTVKTLEAQEVVIDDKYAKSVQFTKRRFRDAQETAKMLEEAMLNNYTSAVSPISVRTMSLLVGDESLQFRFVDNRTNPSAVAHSVTYDNDTMKLTADAGLIQHLTLGISSLSSSHKVSEYRFWSVGAFTSAVLTDTAQGYFLYIKAARDSDTATFHISPTAIGMTDVDGYYFFLVGILNSEYNGERSFVTLYGYSEVLPGRVTTDRVVSGDGESYFDMVADAMKLGDALDFNSAGDGKLRLKGTLVQNQGGDESPVGLYRGVYNASYTYYSGDEVFYTLGGVTSTYRYINATASKGHAPTEAAYWQVQAAGVKGDPGTDGVDGKDGKDGVDGKDGTDGADGKPSYLHIKYSDDGGHTFTQNVGTRLLAATALRFTSGGGLRLVGETPGELAGAWIGTYTDDNPEDSLHPSDYKWAKVKGATGDYYEYRYAKNGSTTVPPSIDTTERTPDGWDTAVPTVGELEYLWATMAKISGDDDTLLQEWSAPVRFSGEKGEKGDSPALVFRGEYDETATYYGNAHRVDAVKHDGAYYVARTDAGTFSGTTPTDTSKWNSFGASFESIATGLMLAEKSYIDNLMVRDLKTYESDNLYLQISSETNDFKAVDTNGVCRLRINGGNQRLSAYDAQEQEVLQVSGNAIETQPSQFGQTHTYTINNWETEYDSDLRTDEDGQDYNMPEQEMGMGLSCYLYKYYTTGNKGVRAGYTFGSCEVESAGRLQMNLVFGGVDQDPFSPHSGPGSSNPDMLYYQNLQYAVKLNGKVIASGNKQSFRDMTGIDSWYGNWDLAIGDAYTAAIDIYTTEGGILTVELWYEYRTRFSFFTAYFGGAIPSGVTCESGYMDYYVDTYLSGVSLTFTVTDNIAVTKIGTNGLLSAWNSTKYLFYNQLYGFEVRAGNYVLRISSSGIQKSVNGGTTWTSL